MFPKCIHHQACFRECSLPLRNLTLREYNLKIFADLLQQFPLQVSDIPTQSRNLVDGSIALEVRHELYDGLQERRTFPILPRLAQSPQLLVCCGQHLQPLQRRHGQCEIALRAVQPLDVCRHLRDSLFRLYRTLPHILNLLEQIGEL
jgi:hypothetical protein